MATRQEIIDTIDAFLERRITIEEAVAWAQDELKKTSDCEDPAFALYTFICSDSPEEVFGRSLKEQVLMDKEVLVHGVPCPDEELGMTVEAYWLAYTPWKKIVLCQVRITERGERLLEVTEEGWDGTQLFCEEMPLPLKEKNGPPLMWEEIERKRDAYESERLTAQECLSWVVDQLQRENASNEYQTLLSLYWKIRRGDHLFSPEYIRS